MPKLLAYKKKGLPETQYKNHLYYAGIPKSNPDNDLMEPTNKRYLVINP